VKLEKMKTRQNKIAEKNKQLNHLNKVEKMDLKKQKKEKRQQEKDATTTDDIDLSGNIWPD
jgi:hypothetical protein